MSWSFCLAVVPSALVLSLDAVILVALAPSARAARLLLLLTTNALAARYLLWRVFGTMPAPELSAACILTYAVLALEAVAALMSFRGLRAFKQTRDRRLQADAQASWFDSSDGLPLIDFFIPTFNESRGILEKTLAAARGSNYPRFRIWLLDDGARSWVPGLATKYGAECLQRPDRRFYKAGNLNHALAHVTALEERAEYIAVLDADFIINPNFLRRVLALMAEDDVGLVQTPQFFYNPDPFQYAFDSLGFWPDDQRFHFDCRLPAKDATDSASCAGTSFLIRARALEAIGCFPTESIAEDALTSSKLSRLGWKTVYLHEPLSVGLAPEGLNEFLSQRARWCRGIIQNAYSSCGPLSKGRSVRAYLLLWEWITKWGLSCLLRWIYLCIPALFWLTGISLVRANTLEFALYLLPVGVHGILMSRLWGGAQMPILTDATTIVTGFAVLPATIRAIARSESDGFKVTDKGRSRQTLVVHWAQLCWLLVPALVIIVGMAWNTFKPTASPYSGTYYLWSIYSLAVIGVAIGPCIERPKFRDEERFPIQEDVILETQGKSVNARLIDISITGVRLVIGENVSHDNCSIHIPHVGNVQSTVARRLSESELAVRFQTTETEYRRLVRKIFSDGPGRPRQDILSPWRCYVAVARRAISIGRRSNPTEIQSAHSNIEKGTVS